MLRPQEQEGIISFEIGGKRESVTEQPFSPISPFTIRNINGKPEVTSTTLDDIIPPLLERYRVVTRFVGGLTKVYACLDIKGNGLPSSFQTSEVVRTWSGNSYVFTKVEGIGPDRGVKEDIPSLRKSVRQLLELKADGYELTGFYSSAVVFIPRSLN